MADWIPQAVETVGTILGGAGLVAVIQGWNDRRKRALDLSGEDRKDVVGFLREALGEKKKDHLDCTARVEKVEAAMFREQQAALLDRKACHEETKFLREVALEAYVKSTPPNRQDKVLLAKLRQPMRPLVREEEPEGGLDQDPRRG